MHFTFVSVFALSAVVSAGSGAPLVKSVTIRGTQLHVNLATQVGQPYDADAVGRDVRQLWATQRFSDIRVNAAQDADGTDVIFEVTPAPHREPPPVQPPQDHTRIRVKQVAFTGEPGIDAEELRRALRSLRARRIVPGIPGMWSGWRLLASYSREAVDADLARLRSFYFSRGYFDASVRLEDAEVSQPDAYITFFVRSGPRYETRESMPQLCSSLLAQRRDAERQGILDFSATLHVQFADTGSNRVNLTTTIDQGRDYHIGRITFQGNHHYSDSMLRRNLLIEEGQLLDEYLLRKTAARLNQTNLFEPITSTNIAIQTDEKTGIANVAFRLTERKRGAWNLSGPVGPASFAGPLVASIGSRLPPWGAGLLELSTYTASISVIAFAHPLLPALALSPKRRLLPVLALSRPFLPGEGWKSGFTIAPQLGLRAFGLTYATTQFEQRLLPVLSGDRGLVPVLPVNVEGPNNNSGVMFCEPPAPRLMPLRTASSWSLRLFGTLTGF
jgi:hypothetical protein